MSLRSRKRSNHKHFAHFYSSTGPGKPILGREGAILGVKSHLRRYRELELRINGYQTVVRGGDIDRIFAMLERGQIGVRVR